MSQTITPYADSTAAKKQQVADMFNKISGTYDFLNHFLSLGIDTIWRKKAIAKLKHLAPKYILDVATGTGDLAIEAIHQLKPTKVIGIDIAQQMLDIADKKIIKNNFSDTYSVQLADSEHLPFEANTFDAITVAFGVRNFENLTAGLNEMYRVTKPNGMCVILEFSRPTVFPIKQLYNFYFLGILPFFGKIFSSDNSAYTYLPQSVMAFPDGDAFLDILQQTGFKNGNKQTLTFGICTIYTATK